MAKIVSATDYQKNISEHHDAALKEPVIITSHGRPRLVICSHDRYQELWAAWKRAQNELIDASEHSAVDKARLTRESVE